MKKNIVFVVAWKYNSGGGFDWYHKKEAAAKSWIDELENEKDPGLKSCGWKAFYFEHTTEIPLDLPEEITNEIDGVLLRRQREYFSKKKGG